MVESLSITKLLLQVERLEISKADLPPLKSAYVEGAPGPAPYQAKAVGELANCAVPAALASAVAQAVGARITSLPITAEKVWAALRRPEGTPVE